jgi:hypothetical protein
VSRWGVWWLGFGSRPVAAALWVVVAGVGLLFEIWIVDASIKFFLCSCVECASPAWRAGRVLCLVCPVVGGWGVGGGWGGLVVCVTSCEGHMVDALASRADEGRRSLR